MTKIALGVVIVLMVLILNQIPAEALRSAGVPLS